MALDALLFVDFTEVDDDEGFRGLARTGIGVSAILRLVYQYLLGFLEAREPFFLFKSTFVANCALDMLVLSLTGGSQDDVVGTASKRDMKAPMESSSSPSSSSLVDNGKE